MSAPAEPGVYTHATEALSFSLRFWTETLERTEAQRRDALEALGTAIRALDQLFADLHAQPIGSEERTHALASLIQQRRKQAFEAIRTYAPDEAYYWTPAWQEGEREVEAQLAAGAGVVYEDEDAFESALAAIDLQRAPHADI